MVQNHRSVHQYNTRIAPSPVQPLTEDQDRFLRDLFQKYTPQDLSVEDAVEIIEALDSIGIRGPAVRALVLKAGLDPQKFRALISSEAAPHP